MTILETLSNHPAVQQAIGFAQENNLAQISPEIIIATTIVFALWSAMYRREDERQNTWLVALIGIIAALVCLALHFFNLFLPGIQVNEVPSIPVLGGIYVSDLFGLIIRTLLVLGTGLVLFMN
jgi:NADH:ubiquinone oxidoreductase subunit 2 (subunit N)